ncbi:hypothetical protein COLO4_11797 [Corchorus olitorius]|uniref:RNase H type-1 domain-containing protein n=1 Tax=Corchorus olitorius TaxID=93759 RepID=A0A1R3K390_9ROSI|nr:hypothetical protein COLO4_11797 [Corchorus olitorius]
MQPSLAKETHWEAPGQSEIKVNFDGAYDSRGKTGACGAIARDSTGLVLGAYAGRLGFVSDVYAAECKAALKAAKWARDMGFTRIILEGDALTVIKKANSSETDLSPIAAYIADLKEAQNWFEKCSFSHVGRKGNRAADFLAQLGKSYSESIVWMEHVPECLSEIIQQDCTGFQ